MARGTWAGQEARSNARDKRGEFICSAESARRRWAALGFKLIKVLLDVGFGDLMHRLAPILCHSLLFCRTFVYI